MSEIQLEKHKQAYLNSIIDSITQLYHDRPTTQGFNAIPLLATAQKFLGIPGPFAVKIEANIYVRSDRPGVHSAEAISDIPPTNRLAKK